jgi:rhodanese-related sulfurtransferase
MNSANINPLSAGLLILALGLLCITPGVDAGNLDETSLRVLGNAITKDQDYITGEDLAQWIMQDKKDYYLIDIRNEAEYEQSHIQGAANIPLLKLFDLHQIDALPRHKIIITYSNTSMRSAQAATMLRLAGLDAYSLIGGYEYWVMHTLNPKAAPEQHPDQETLDDARRAAMARALKNCEMPAPCAGSVPGYTPPLTPVEETAPAIPASGGGVLLDEGC